MNGANKGIRLESVCAPLATEVVSSDIRLEIRYDVVNYELRITKQRSAVANYE
jgi:hypothetical protein